MIVNPLTDVEFDEALQAVIDNARCRECGADPGQPCGGPLDLHTDRFSRYTLAVLHKIATRDQLADVRDLHQGLGTVLAAADRATWLTSAVAQIAEVGR
jgi:hypothetical protein